MNIGISSVCLLDHLITLEITLLTYTVPAVAPATLFEHSSAFTNINVSWHKISFLDENGPDFTYIVFYVSNGVEVNTTTLNNFATITDLEECTNYSITVGTQNSQGVFSNRSSEIMFETQSVSGET